MMRVLQWRIQKFTKRGSNSARDFENSLIFITYVIINGVTADTISTCIRAGASTNPYSGAFFFDDSPTRWKKNARLRIRTLDLRLQAAVDDKYTYLRMFALSRLGLG